ncbi:hypothetical protein BUALT_Bualt03G0016700 [Buddleja alternifolia]|uniref:Germin-like protein n=1 Tax=Buddleja alternifolia TaxID=168488 RepID=A0AAV6XQD6_9LAMI|nr:hypothetical protein BUALT_Bualt03G0016700 [Buddleja alternifolia]
MASRFIVLGLVIATCSFALASDPILLNGFSCKGSKMAQPTDFSFSGLHIPGNTSNPIGSRVTPVTVTQIPGLITLGISMVRLDFAPWENNLITKVLQKGDVFVFPKGLVHFQRNTGYGYTVAIAALSSQNPGVITIANTVFGSNPAIANDLLAKSFQPDTKTIDWIQSKF